MSAAKKIYIFHCVLCGESNWSKNSLDEQKISLQPHRKSNNKTKSKENSFILDLLNARENVCQHDRLVFVSLF